MFKKILIGYDGSDGAKKALTRGMASPLNRPHQRRADDAYHIRPPKMS
jgi:nucleotide-binding universal stress UspA family protein